MASRLPNEDEDEANAAAAAAAFQSALAQQVRPLLGCWDPLSAMAAMHRNILQQQQQNNGPQNGQSAAQAVAAAAAAANMASNTSPATSMSAGIPSMWPYGLSAAAAAAVSSNNSVISPPPVSSATAAAASLASSLGPATNYLNHLQNLHSPESLLSFQQNLLMLEQLQQQRQLLAANPHLLMAAAAAQSSNQNPANLQSHTNGQQHQQQLHQQLLHQQQQLLLHQNLLATVAQQRGSPLTANSPTTLNFNHHSLNLNNGTSNTSSLLTTVNANLNSSLTNQHQDSLVDQHFRRSLGEDYNQIMSGKIDNKINVGK